MMSGPRVIHPCNDPGSPGDGILYFYLFLFFSISFSFIFIWLCQVLVTAQGIFDLCRGIWDLFSCGMQTLICSMWDLVP